MRTATATHPTHPTHLRGATENGPGGGPAHGSLVDADWLEAHLDDPAVRVVEVDVSPVAHQDWHIDGSVLWDVYADLKDADYRLLGASSLERLLGRSGITPDTTVVFYGYAPALGLWLLELYGHEDARLLDCSRGGWRAAGRPWTGVTGEPDPVPYHLAGPLAPVRATLEDVRVAACGADPLLLDVRTREEYVGERFWPSGGAEPGGRAGHVPSALHHPLGDLFDEQGAFMDEAGLRRAFAPALAALDGGQDVITYCTIGGRAATAWFVLAHLLGREGVRVYDGSWAEWGRNPDTPVART